MSSPSFRPALRCHLQKARKKGNRGKGKEAEGVKERRVFVVAPARLALPASGDGGKIRRGNGGSKGKERLRHRSSCCCLPSTGGGGKYRKGVEEVKERSFLTADPAATACRLLGMEEK